MALKWYHVDLPELPKDELKIIVIGYLTIHKPTRFFYLFEGNPYCFLAMELKRKPRDGKLSYDEKNGEEFLDAMHIMSKVSLFGNINFDHLIHCIVNQRYPVRAMELAFYKDMFLKYMPNESTTNKSRATGKRKARSS